MESLVVNALVEVLDEDVSLASLPQGGVTLRPHDSARLTLDERVVEVLKSPLAVGSVEVVDIGVTERSSSDGVTANTDTSQLVSSPLNQPTAEKSDLRSNRTDHVEDLEEHSLGNAGVELTNIEGSGNGVTTGGSGGRGRSRSALGGGGLGGGGRRRGSLSNRRRGGGSFGGHDVVFCCFL